MMVAAYLKRLDSYKIAVVLSSLSIFFGIFREFLIIGIFGFTAQNDMLQLYLSIFYSLGLMIDSMRLACLNLYAILSLPRILLSATVISLPFCIVVGLMMSYATKQLDVGILSLTIFGSFLNLIAALLITYKQRGNNFLKAQIVNIMPNFILIPGILFFYYVAKPHLIFCIIALTTLIPVAQCSLLLCMRTVNEEDMQPKAIGFFASIVVFIRHFAAMVGEQLFQIVARSTFYNYGTGYLTVFALIIRLYAAARFILIDSFIGSKLATWKRDLDDEYFLSKMINSTSFAMAIALIALSISLKPLSDLAYASAQIILILICGFYFSTLVRIIYFKINRLEINRGVVWHFALYELLCAGFAFAITYEFNHPILAILWIGYIAKPFAQLLLLRKRFYGLEVTA